MTEENKAPNVVVETYADDLAKAVTSNENGMIKKIIEEEERHDFENKKGPTENQTNKIFLFVGMLLVLLSFVAVSLVFFFKKEIFTVEVPPQYTPIIFTDKTEFKDVSLLKKDQITQTFFNEINTSEFKVGGVEGVYFSVDKNVIGFRKFLEMIEANLDKNKIEFISDNFLIGAINNNGRSPFLLIKMRSIADVFESMRLWENKMYYDLHGLFGLSINVETKYLLDKNFEDGIVQNKNARILRDKNGRIMMMYVFAEEDSLIIANSEATVAEVMLRLAKSQIKK